MLEQTALAENEECRFCVSKPGRRIMLEGQYCFAAWDRHPASPGHFLVAEGKLMADEQHDPDGYNIGINVGIWAGQSIPHLHIHVIPRYRGDVENPKGGVRGVIPESKLYTFKPD